MSQNFKAIVLVVTEKILKSVSGEGKVKLPSTTTVEIGLINNS